MDDGQQQFPGFNNSEIQPARPAAASMANDDQQQQQQQQQQAPRNDLGPSMDQAIDGPHQELLPQAGHVVDEAAAAGDGPMDAIVATSGDPLEIAAEMRSRASSLARQIDALTSELRTCRYELRDRDDFEVRPATIDALRSVIADIRAGQDVVAHATMVLRTSRELLVSSDAMPPHSSGGSRRSSNNAAMPCLPPRHRISGSPTNAASPARHQLPTAGALNQRFPAIRDAANQNALDAVAPDNVDPAQASGTLDASSVQHQGREVLLLAANTMAPAQAGPPVPQWCENPPPAQSGLSVQRHEHHHYFGVADWWMGPIVSLMGAIILSYPDAVSNLMSRLFRRSD
eukprot:jgi/Tetstr1/446662/TSEL_034183.t1